MRIRGSKDKRSLNSPRKARQAEKTDGKKFSGLLGEKEENLQVEEMNRILKDIDRQGEILKKSGRMTDLKAYKKEVRRFLRVANKGGLRTKQISSMGPDGSMKQYTVIEKVDEVLAELTEAFLNKESRNLDLMGKIEEIRGLLVDVFA